MDYDDPFFKTLQPQNEKQRNFVYWVLMTHAHGRDTRYGHIPHAGINPIVDVFYSSLGNAILAQQVAELHHTFDVETQKRMEELALMAGKASDDATSLGSALMAFEEEMVRRGETRFTLELERRSMGGWSINKMVHEPSILKAVVAYCLRRLNKDPRNK